MLKTLKAGVWFTSAGLPVYAIGVGKKHVIVNLWHGVPLKRIALCEENVSLIARLYFRKVFSDNYKYIVTTSENLIHIMANSFEVEKNKVKVWGQPRNDMLLQPDLWIESLEEIVPNIKKYKKAIIYAPTYRDDKKTKWFNFQDFDINVLKTYLKENGILLCLRAHLEDEGLYGVCDGDNIIDLSSKVIDDITSYLYLFDMLITDYSSMYIDYLLLDRPMIFLPYDKEEYLLSRGMNFEYDAVTPGAKPSNFKEFLNEIDKGLFGKDIYIKEREKVNYFFNQVHVPSSENICKIIFEEMKEIG